MDTWRFGSHYRCDLHLQQQGVELMTTTRRCPIHRQPQPCRACQPGSRTGRAVGKRPNPDPFPAGNAERVFKRLERRVWTQQSDAVDLELKALHDVTAVSWRRGTPTGASLRTAALMARKLAERFSRLAKAREDAEKCT